MAKLMLTIFAGAMVGALTPAAAPAFMLKMEGQAVETASALYERTSDGHLTRVAALGDRVPGAGQFLEFGTPALAPNGTIIFGAEVENAKSRRWSIFVARPSSGGAAIAEAFDDSAIHDDCRPLLKSDPYAMTDAKGSILFLAPQAHGPDALFRYSGGKLSCTVRVGDRTREGNRIASLHFGSAQTAADGAVVLSASVYPGLVRGKTSRNAVILMSPRGGISTVALEGRPSSGGGRYVGRFGLPALSGSGAARIVAFVDRDAKGKSTLFVGRPDRVARAAYTGMSTSAGPISYLSDGRPGLSDDGVVAIRIATGDRSSIAVVRSGEPRLIVGEGDRANGMPIAGLADPAAISGGQVYLEETDPQRRLHILSLPAAEGDANAIADGVPVFPDSLAVNRHGAVAFLAEPKQPAAASTNERPMPDDQGGASI